MVKTRQFDISKQLFVQAYKMVKANAGAAGIDKISIDIFAKDFKNNIYKLWNRMSSGSYFPPTVKAIEIPKKSGGKRVLGIPTVGDRICQAVVKLSFEPEVEKIFLNDSYGYRPNKSALEAIGVTRQRCFKYPWVVEFDIKASFDNIPHDLLIKAVEKHSKRKWELLYIKRWLKADMQRTNGEVVGRECGTPQGGVISPVLSNLFLHYTFDAWVTKHFPTIKWCRYADDGLLHCRNQHEAIRLLSSLKQRFSDCGLELHPDKTQIVYCKMSGRKENYPIKSFDFLGFTFRSRTGKKSGSGKLFTTFTPAVSKTSMNAMRAKIRRSNVRNRSDLSLEEIARWFNPTLQGWLNYYGKYNRSELYKVWRHFNQTLLISWAMRKYKKLQRRKTRAGTFMEQIAKSDRQLFAHWKVGMIGVLI